MNASARFVVEGRLEHLAEVRRRMLGLLSGSAVTADGEMIALCVVEAVANSIIHAYDRREGTEVSVSVDISPRRLTVSVCDTGRAMDRSLLHRPIDEAKTMDEVHERGRGLEIIRSVMGHVTYRRFRGQNILSMTRRVAKEKP